MIVMFAFLGVCTAVVFLFTAAVVFGTAMALELAYAVIPIIAGILVVRYLYARRNGKLL